MSAPNYRIRPGRDLRHAPRWSCSNAAVVFDAASGDYWVLTPVADALLRRLALGALSFDALMASELRGPIKSAAYVREVLDGLVESDLLAA